MEERPIIFKGEMVRAILEGRKTQTRRAKGLERVNSNPDDFWLHIESSNGLWIFDQPSGDLVALKCPYGQAGDRLWVRETWGQAINIAEGDTGTLYYKATNETNWQGKWHPSIHMPRWASRILLEITEVRVERVQEISLVSIRKEGISDNRATGNAPFQLQKWIDLWNSIHGSDAWERNDWVWVISFKRC